MDDNDQQDIFPIIQQTHDFIAAAIADGGRVLVHCEEGISCSSTIVCAWLIMHQHACMGEHCDDDDLIFIRVLVVPQIMSRYDLDHLPPRLLDNPHPYRHQHERP